MQISSWIISHTYVSLSFVSRCQNYLIFPDLYHVLSSGKGTLVCQWCILLARIIRNKADEFLTIVTTSEANHFEPIWIWLSEFYLFQNWLMSFVSYWWCTYSDIIMTIFVYNLGLNGTVCCLIILFKPPSPKKNEKRKEEIWTVFLFSIRESLMITSKRTEIWIGAIRCSLFHWDWAPNPPDVISSFQHEMKACFIFIPPFF